MMFKPHPYQQYCIDRIVNEPALGLFLDMGLGKTVITLTALLELLYHRFGASRVLVVAPKKVAQATWSKEAAKWEHLRLLRISEVLGTATQRIRALATPADVYVTSRDTLTWLVEYYRNDWPFDVVILDESSSFKNQQSKRFKALKLVRSRIGRIVELTGTPAPNSLLDLWAQIFLLDGGQRLGKTIGGFRERYFLPDKRSRQQVFSYKPKEGADTTVRQLIGDICISMKAEDYLQLPDCLTVDVPVALDGPAKKAYKRLEREMLLQVEEELITAESTAVLTGKLLQLCNGAVYDGEHRAVQVHDCKLEAFLESVEALQGQHALVFYSFQHDKERILEALAKTGLRVACLQGPQEEQAWNQGEIDILLAHPASCAYGLNLQQGGRHIIWFGQTWSLELYQQAVGRLHRQGQTQPVIVHRLITQGGVDEDVVAALESKGQVQDGILEALKARIRAAKEG